ncbi:S-layer homology domain-containing protein [Tissierella praeacuta]|uniref:S-layer homology domain-containing protein n=1 Tax=Tissierella praeacuta TaxID=43131 RepID=UPI0028AF1A99|nr:S-layer homology domain-containing protein [Tissierella praeacuta]
MNKMKRIFSFLLVLSMILGSFAATLTVAHAETAVETADKALKEVPKDVKGTEYEKAISRLVAFGIIGGYPDGTFRPENDVTRAEFAKILVEALGLGSAANAAVGRTNFSDVPASHWAAGYINVASGQGLLKGYPNGTFQPSKQVSHAEALTMLVRALGYQDSFLGIGKPGVNWAEAYVAKAAQVGISTGVKFTPNAASKRGTVGILINNTLDAKVIKQVKYGSAFEWEEQMITLLEERLKINKLDEVVVVATPKVEKIEKDQIRVEFEKDVYYTDAIRKADKEKRYEKGDDETFDIDERVVDLDAINSKLGESLNIYINDKDEIVYFELSDRPFKVFYDTIDGEEYDSYEDYEILLVNEDKGYDIQKGGKDVNEAVFYVDNTSVKNFKDFYEISKKTSENNKHLFAKVVLNRRGNVKLVDAHYWEGNPGVVRKADKDEIVYFDNDEDDEKKIKAKDYDKIQVIDNKGQLMKMEDIKKDDVVYLNDKFNVGSKDGDDLEEASSKDEVAYVLVVRNKLEGKLESYREGKNGNVIDVEIDGKKYDVTSGRITTVSIDSDATIEMIDMAKDKLDDLSADKAAVTLLLDASGDVRHIRGGIESASGALYGVVTGVDRKYGDIYVKLLNYEEKTVEYELDLDDNKAFGYKGKNHKTLAAADNKDNGNGVDVSRGDIVRYKVNSKGDIKEIELIAYYDGSKFHKAEGEASKDMSIVLANADQNYDIAKKGIRLDGDKSFTMVKDDVAVFNYSPAFGKDGKTLEDAADVEYAKWSDIVDKSIKKETPVVIAKDTRRDAAELVVFLKNFEEIGDSSFVGYVTSMRKNDGDGFADIVYAGSDKEVRVELSNSSQYEVEGGFERRNIALFVEKSNGKVEANFGHKDLQAVTGKVDKIAGKYITLIDREDRKDAKTTVVRVDNETVFYRKGTKITLSDINEGDYIRAGIKEGIAGVVKKYDINEKDVKAGTDGEVKLFFRDFKFDMKKNWSDNATTTPEDGKGLVSYISLDGKAFELDGKAYKIDADTRLVVNGKTIAMGVDEIKAKLAVGDKVTVKDNVITRESTLAEREEEKALTKAVKDAEEALEAYIAAGGKAEDQEYKDLKAALAAKPQVRADIENATRALVAKTEELKADENVEKEVANFKATHADVLALTEDTVKVSDKAKVNYTSASFELLSAGAKAKLATEKALLTKLQNKIAELEAAAVVTEELNTAKAAIEAATYELNKTDHDEEGKAENAVKGKVNGLTEVSGKGFTVSIEDGSFVKAEDGVSDGSYEFKVKLEKSGQDVTTKVIKVTIAK